MSEALSDSGTTCASFQRDIPLHALGARGGLETEDSARLERHLAQCAACRGLFEIHRQVLETVRQESSPSVLLDTDRVLRALQKRIAEGTRVDYAPVPAVSPRGRILWLVSLAAVAVAAGIAIAVYRIPGGPQGPPVAPGSGSPVRIALRYAPGQSAGEALEAGQEVAASVSGIRVCYTHGVVVRPRERTRMLLSSAHELLLAEGAAAIFVPHEGETFQVRMAAGGALASGQPGSRFTLAFDAGGKPAVAVAEGSVEFRGPAGAPVLVEAGYGSRLTVAGAAETAAPLDAREAFAWVLEGAYEGLQCEFQIGVPIAGVRIPATLALLNAGAQPVRVANFNALGVNYFLEIRGAGERSPKSVRLLPRALHRRLAGGGSESYTPAKSEVQLEPGDRYELELDLFPHLEGKGPFVLAANYIGFEGDPAGASGKGTWGFALRSAEVFFKPSTGAKTTPATREERKP